MGQGLVASLSRSGGNVTGMSSAARDIGAKELALLEELVPGLSRIVVLWTSTTTVHRALLKDVEAAAKSMRLQARTLEVRTPEGLEQSFKAIPAQRAEALMPLDGPFMVAQRRRIAEFALRSRMPAVCSNRLFAEAGRTRSSRARSPPTCPCRSPASSSW